MIVLIIFLSVGTVLTFRITRRLRAKQKVKMLKIEERVLEKLTKKAQEDRFKKKTLPATYEIRVTKYREKLADIKGKLPGYEALARGEKLKKNKIKKSKESSNPKHI